MKSLRGLNDYRLKRQQCTFIANQQQLTQVSRRDEPTIHDDTYGGTLDPYETKEPVEIQSSSDPTDSALGEGTLTTVETMERAPEESTPRHDDEDDVKVELDEFVTQWEDSEHSVKEDGFSDSIINNSQLSLNVLMKEEE